MARKRRPPFPSHPEDVAAASGYRLHIVAEEGAAHGAPSGIKRRGIGGKRAHARRGVPHLHLILGGLDASVTAATVESGLKRPVPIGGVRSDIVK